MGVPPGDFSHRVQGIPGPPGQQEWQAQLRRKPDAPPNTDYRLITPVRAATPEGAIAVAQEMHLSYEVERVSPID